MDGQKLCQKENKIGMIDLKKIIILMIIPAFLLGFWGCTVAVKTNQKEPLNFSVTKEMEESHVGPENTENLRILKELIVDNPNIGSPGEFSFLYSGKDAKVDDRYATFYFAINRTDHVLKNITFTLNIQVDDQYLMQNSKVNLPEDVFGELPVDTAKPVSIFLTAEQKELLSKITNENLKVSITDYAAEDVD
jgi:hypothetical protein